jgi:predicted metal-binding membrane protein
VKMPAEGGSLTESFLRRDRWIVLAGLAALTIMSWAYILAGAGMGMSVRDMTVVSLFPHRMTGMPMGGMSIPMQSGLWSAGYFIIILIMWWVMMIAMMTPSAAPMILLYARATRHAQATGQLQHGAVPTATFVGGYLLVWLGFSLLAAAMQWALERAGLVSAMMMASVSAAVSATVLFVAGLYQLSALKHVCLRHCRAPAQFLSRNWRPGTSGALHMGLQHGAFCVGCCWVLMALLFVGGIMNVVWIAALAIFVLLEKVVPRGEWLARATGVVLLAWGTATLVM